MLLTAVWLELLLSALLLWAGLVRANSYFSTPWLRWLFILPAWLASAGLLFAVGFYPKLPLQTVQEVASIRECAEILADGRVGICVTCVAAWPLISLGLLIVGLSRRKGESHRDVPKARDWRWWILVGGAAVAMGAIWGETEWTERSLLRDTEATAEQARVNCGVAEMRNISPVPEGENAAEPYHQAAELLPPPLKQWDDWYSPAEIEPAMKMFAAAGRRARCSTADLRDRLGRNAFDSKAAARFASIIADQYMYFDDPATYCEMISAVRDFSTHRCRDPKLFSLEWDWENSYLRWAAWAGYYPELLGPFDRGGPARDYAETILGGFEADAMRIEADNAATVSMLFDPPALWDKSAFYLNMRVKVRPFDRDAVGLRRFAMRIRRAADAAEVVRIYQNRIDQFRQCVASTKALGRTVWPAWRDLRGVSLDKGTWEDLGHAALQDMLTDAYRRHSILTSRRLANATLAVVMFREDKGRLPAAWEELVPQYLPTPPIDLMTGKPLGFKTTAEGAYLFAAERPDGECPSLSELEQFGEKGICVGLAVRVAARLPADEPSAKLPNPAPGPPTNPFGT